VEKPTLNSNNFFVAKDPVSNPVLESELSNISSSMRMEDVFPIIGYPRRIPGKNTRESLQFMKLIGYHEISRICFLVEGELDLDSK
jgi:hypothetical protein